MRLDVEECRRRLAGLRHAVLATAGTDLAPRAVPIAFAVDTGTESVGPDPDLLVTAVDGKPKSTLDLARLRTVRANPQVAVLGERYDDDWSRLWWVRVDALARVVEAGDERDRALVLLAARYPQYRAEPPPGPVIVIRARRWSGWAAGPVRPAG